MNDLTNKRAGKLIAQWSVGKNIHRRIMWLCLCDCGKMPIISSGNFGRQSNSCGCSHIGQNHPQHGHSSGGNVSRTYQSWSRMWQRCTNSKLECWKNYGGRGIKVSKRWKNFKHFLTDMGERPIGTSIDRINNDGNYERGNCRWATPLQQRHNRRTN
jgi:hypothetical protein